VINAARLELDKFQSVIHEQEEAMCQKVNKDSLEHFERFCQEQYLDRDQLNEFKHKVSDRQEKQSAAFKQLED
jgi:hypothetical protein